MLSYLLSGIVQIESIRRQGLLEMPTSESRLEELRTLSWSGRSRSFGGGLGSYVPDPRLSMLRRLSARAAKALARAGADFLLGACS